MPRPRKEISPFRALSPEQLQRGVKVLEGCIAGHAEELARVIGTENAEFLRQTIGHLGSYTDGTLVAVRAMEDAILKAPFSEARKQFLLLNVRSWWVDPSQVARTAKLRITSEALREATEREDGRTRELRSKIETVRLPGEQKTWRQPEWESVGQGVKT